MPSIPANIGYAAEAEPEFYQFVPEETTAKPVDENAADSVDSNGNKIIYCSLPAVSSAIENLSLASERNSLPPLYCSLIKQKLPPVEKLLALKKQVEALKDDDVPLELYNETMNLLKQKLANYYSRMQAAKSATVENCPLNQVPVVQTDADRLGQQLANRLANIEHHLGISDGKCTIPISSMASALEHKISLLDSTLIDSLYRKLKLLAIECEKAKEKCTFAESFEAKVNELYEKYSGMQPAYSQIIPVSKKLKSIEEMRLEAEHVNSVLSELKEQKYRIIEMIGKLSDHLRTFEAEFSQTKDKLSKDK